jgi:hypothetical protein
MSYVIVGILLLLIVGGFVIFMTMQATKRAHPATATDGEDAAPGIGADEQSPLGTTTQHADHDGGDQRTGSGQDRPDGRFQRDPVGGEAEARPFTE